MNFMVSGFIGGASQSARYAATLPLSASVRRRSILGGEQWR
jgi:hypothetical protein